MKLAKFYFLLIFLSTSSTCWSLKRVLSNPRLITDVVFGRWMKKFNITFKSQAEMLEAKKTFQINFMATLRHNLQYYTERSDFMVKLNQFAVLDDKTVLNGADLSDFVEHMEGVEARTHTSPVYPTPPPSLDYRTMGYVTSVKDQGFMCSSCYAFAAVCGLEGQIFRKYGRLKELSSQNIVDCSGTQGNLGCDGGSIGLSFKYVVNNPGIANESTYPYAGYSQSCYYNPSMYAEKAISYAFVTGDENYLKSALAAIGPLAVGMKGSVESFYYYSNGIYDDPACTNQIDHAVCLVGYGTDPTTGTQYWIAKNSWSDLWGESGYFRLKMGSNLCGIRNYVVYPNV